MARARQFNVNGQDSEYDMDVIIAKTRRGNTDVGLAGFGERPQKYLYRNYARGLRNQPLSMYNDMLS